MIVLEIHPEEQGVFSAYLDDEFIVRSKTPILDGARKLLKRGFSGRRLMTARAAGRSYNSIEPRRISVLAGLRIAEPDKGPLQVLKWEPSSPSRPPLKTHGGHEGEAKTATP